MRSRRSPKANHSFGLENMDANVFPAGTGIDAGVGLDGTTMVSGGNTGTEGTIAGGTGARKSFACSNNPDIVGS
jgi:hypothetical protein